MTEQKLVQTLYRWLQQQLDTDNVANVARRFDYAIKTPAYMGKIYKELFHLNMWLILISCQRNSLANSSLNQCLDGFFRVVYENCAEAAKNDFRSWLLSIGRRYIKNVDVTKTGSQLGLASALAKRFSLNLFGFISRNPYIQTQIMAYVKNNCDSLQYLIDGFIRSNGDGIKTRANVAKEAVPC